MVKLVFSIYSVFLLLASFQVQSCHLSDFTLISVSGTGPYTITAKLCVGHGVTGVTNGGDSETRSIGFAFRGAGVVISGFSPASVTGSFTGCTMSGSNIGAIGFPINATAAIMYLDPGYYGAGPCVTKPYGCVTSTALCGDVSQMCTDFTFITNVMPTEIQAFGVESDGNPTGGCYSESDMLVNNFSLSVEWNDIKAISINKDKVKLNWSTFSESNNNYFVVEKTHDIHDYPMAWVSCDTLMGNNLDQFSTYYYTDRSPLSGDDEMYNEMVYYRIKQVDFSGLSTYSKVIQVNLSEQRYLKIYPNPTNSLLTVESSVHDRLEFVNNFGQVYVDSRTLPISLDVSDFPSGLYYLKLYDTSGGISIHKVVVK